MHAPTTSERYSKSLLSSWRFIHTASMDIRQAGNRPGAATKSLDHDSESWILYQGDHQRLFWSFGFTLALVVGVLWKAQGPIPAQG